MPSKNPRIPTLVEPNTIPPKRLNKKVPTVNEATQTRPPKSPDDIVNLRGYAIKLGAVTTSTGAVVGTIATMVGFALANGDTHETDPDKLQAAHVELLEPEQLQIVEIIDYIHGQRDRVTGYCEAIYPTRNYESAEEAQERQENCTNDALESNCNGMMAKAVSDKKLTEEGREIGDAWCNYNMDFCADNGDGRQEDPDKKDVCKFDRRK